MGFFDNIDPNEISNDDSSVVITPSAVVEDDVPEFEDADIIQDVDTISEDEPFEDNGTEIVFGNDTPKAKPEEKKPEPTPVAPTPAPAKKPSEPIKPVKADGTVINKGTKIIGSVLSDGDVVIEGTVDGSVTGVNVTIGSNGIVCNGVKASSEVSVIGVVQGDIEGDKVSIGACKITGTITSNNDVLVTEKAKIVGDIKSANVTVNGAVKGNIEGSGTVTIGSSGAVKGNIKASEIVISKGAKLQGSIERTGAEIDDGIFE